MINSAVLPLHFLHPLQLIANLIQNIRNPVAAFWNAACVSIQLRILLVCIQQICYCLCRRYNVSAIVPGIVPAAGNINLLIGAINGRHGAVACRVTKGAVLNRSAAALQIEHLHAVIQQVAVNIVPDLKGVGGIQAAAGDVVLARGGNLRKITNPVGFVGRAVGLVPGQLPGVNSLLGDSVHNGKFAGTAHIAKYCRFLAVAAIANLVGHNGRLVGSGCGVVHLAVVDQLQGHVIQVNGMLRQSTIRFLNPAVEYKLGHDVGILLHGEGIVHTLGRIGQIQPLPGICLVGAAVLLDHAFYKPVGAAGNVILEPIHPVLVQGNDVVEYLNRIIHLAYVADLQRQSAVFRGQRAGTAAFLVGTPAGSTGLKSRIGNDVACCQSGHSGQCRQCGYQH